MASANVREASAQPAPSTGASTDADPRTRGSADASGWITVSSTRAPPQPPLAFTLEQLRREWRREQSLALTFAGLLGGIEAAAFIGGFGVLSTLAQAAGIGIFVFAMVPHPVWILPRGAPRAASLAPVFSADAGGATLGMRGAW